MPDSQDLRELLRSSRFVKDHDRVEAVLAGRSAACDGSVDPSF
jgi:hypothetical protein